jgi:hypothetical protein
MSLLASGVARTGALVLMTSTAWADVPERFMSGTDSRYPAPRFVNGVGQAESLDQAVVRALGSITLQLTLHGTAKLEDETSSESDGRPDPGHERAIQKVKRSVVVEGKIEDWAWLSEVVETYAEGPTVHVRVVIDRQKGSARLRTEAASASAELRRLEVRFGSALAAGQDREASAAFRMMKTAATRISTSIMQATLLDAFGSPSSIETEALQSLASVQAKLKKRWRGSAVGICVESSDAVSQGSVVRRLLVELLVLRGLVPRACSADDEEDGTTLRLSVRSGAQSFAEIGASGTPVFRHQPTIQLEVAGPSGDSLILSAMLTGESVLGTGRSPSDATDASLPKIRTRLDEILQEVFGI